MNGILKGIVIFVAGAAAGALGSAGYFYKKSVKACNEYEEKCDADYQEKCAMCSASKNYGSESLKKSREEKSDKTSESQETQATNKIDYTRFSKPTWKDIVEKAEATLAKEESPMEEANRPAKLRGPRLIKAEDYGNNRTLDTVELFYYTDNGVLANEDDEVIAPESAELLLGDALTKYGFTENDEDYIYVRNEKHGCDYQITKIHAPYNFDG